MKQTQTQDQENKDPHFYGQVILDQLMASKVNGFNFFKYTGIVDYVLFGENQIKLDMPKNPGKLSHVWITYNFGTDAYDLTFCRNNNNMDQAGNMKSIYCDQLAETITRAMGVL